MAGDDPGNPDDPTTGPELTGQQLAELGFLARKAGIVIPQPIAGDVHRMVSAVSGAVMDARSALAADVGVPGRGVDDRTPGSAADD